VLVHAPLPASCKTSSIPPGFGVPIPTLPVVGNVFCAEDTCETKAKMHMQTVSVIRFISSPKLFWLLQGNENFYNT
jgi:hypothetical protein